jgi:hypothetical protein
MGAGDIEALNATGVRTHALVTLLLGVDRELDRPPQIHTPALDHLDAHRDHVVGELACVLRGRWFGRVDDGRRGVYLAAEDLSSPRPTR